MKRLFLLFLLFLAGCGFSPLYGNFDETHGNVPVKVLPIPQTYGNMMHQVIFNRIGDHTESEAKYTLKVSAPHFSSWDQAIDPKNFSSIVGMTASCDYVLTEIKTQKILINHSASLTGSYSVVHSPYATTVAEKKEKQELAKQLAEQISLHVLGVLSKENQ